MKKDVRFNADDLIRALEDTRDQVRGKVKKAMRTTCVPAQALFHPKKPRYS